VPDRAQDTEAIRAARQRLRRACEDGERLYRKRMHDEPTIADDNRIDGILTYDLSDALGAYDRLVARLEAAEQAIWGVWHSCPNYGCVDCICGSHATPDRDCPVHWAVHRLEQAGFDYHQTAAALAAAAPGETTLAEPDQGTGPGGTAQAASPAVRGACLPSGSASAAPGETDQTP
jgi:hypothetical protein